MQIKAGQDLIRYSDELCLRKTLEIANVFIVETWAWNKSTTRLAQLNKFSVTSFHTNLAEISVTVMASEFKKRLLEHCR